MCNTPDKKYLEVCVSEGQEGVEQGFKRGIWRVHLEQASSAMEEFEEKWAGKYPHVIKSWRTNWEKPMTYFRSPVEIRRLMYTTNLIESVNRKFRKVTDGRRLFQSDESVLKALFMAALEIERKWKRPIRDWSLIYSQLIIPFEDRLK